MRSPHRPDTMGLPFVTQLADVTPAGSVRTSHAHAPRVSARGRKDAMASTPSCRALAASTFLLLIAGCGGSETSASSEEADSGPETADAAQGGGSDAGRAEDAAPGSFTLTVTKSGDGKGDVTSSPAGIDCGATCSAPLAAGVGFGCCATL